MVYKVPYSFLSNKKLAHCSRSPACKAPCFSCLKHQKQCTWVDGRIVCGLKATKSNALLCPTCVNGNHSTKVLGVWRTVVRRKNNGAEGRAGTVPWAKPCLGHQKQSNFEVCSLGLKKFEEQKHLLDHSRKNKLFSTRRVPHTTVKTRYCAVLQGEKYLAR